MRADAVRKWAMYSASPISSITSACDVQYSGDRKIPVGSISAFRLCARRASQKQKTKNARKMIQDMPDDLHAICIDTLIEIIQIG